MNKLKDFWNKNRFSIYTSEEKTTLKLIENIVNFINNNLIDVIDNKTDVNGNHLGSWQGLDRPTLSEEGMRATVEKLDDDINNILTHNSISPDAYEGNDCEKIQQAINDAKNNNRCIVIDRIYNLENNTLMLSNEDNIFTRKPITFLGVNNGTIEKNVDGFMFNSLGENQGDFIFNNVMFKSTSGIGVKVLNGSNIIRTKFLNCYFKDVDTLLWCKDDWYVQSITIDNCSVIGGKGYVIDVSGAYDLRIDNCLIETREGFFNHRFNKSALHCQLSSVTIFKNTIEGLHGQLAKFGSTRQLTISDNYFEYNKKDIEFLDNSEIMGVEIKNNSRLGEKLGSDAFITLRGNIHSIISSNNLCDGIPYYDTTSVLYGHVLSTNDKITSETVKGNIDPQNRVLTTLTEKFIINGSESTLPLGLFKRLNNSVSNVTIPEGQFMNVSVPFSEKIYLDDVISIQTTTTNINDYLIIAGYLRQGNTVIVKLKNDGEGTINVANLSVTVLKQYTTITG